MASLLGRGLLPGPLGRLLQAHPCSLLGGSFQIGVQFLLSVVCFSSLLVKWRLERPRRKCSIWILDASKQLFGAGYAHSCNMLLAWFLASATTVPGGEDGDQCMWYFINFVIDVTAGVGISYSILQLIAKVSVKYNIWLYLRDTGNYGNPIEYRVYFAQMFAWILITTATKLLCALIMMSARTFIGGIGALLLAPFSGNPHVELVLVMVVVPLIGNICQFWIQDNFLKKQEKGHAYALSPEAAAHLSLNGEGDPVMEVLHSGGGHPRGSARTYIPPSAAGDADPAPYTRIESNDL